MRYKIYTLKCPLTSNIRYIGRTTDSLSSRLSKHIYERVKYKNHRCHWINSLYKNGQKPIIELLDETEEENLYFTLESYWIYQFRTWGFNLVNETYGGEGSLGYKHTKESKQKISEYWKSVKKQAPRKLTKQEVAKIISEKLSIPVIEYDLSGNLIKEWKSIKEAAKFYDIYPTTICKSARSSQITANGSFWRYKGIITENRIYTTPLKGNRLIVEVEDLIKKIKITFNSAEILCKSINISNPTLQKYMKNNMSYKNRYKFKKLL